MSTKVKTKVFQQFYTKLVQTLPMDDAIFMAKLYTCDLFPGDVKEHVESLIMTTSAQKASYFLDHVIKPSVTSGVGSSFDELVNVMEDSDYHNVKELAKSIKSCQSGVHTTTTEANSEGSAPTVKLCSIVVSRLKARYLNQLPTCKTDYPQHNVFHYVRLALVEKEDVTLRDEHLNEITKLSLKGEVDKILKKKQPLSDLKDIFCYEGEPCPRLVLIMGGPGIGKTTLANEVCVKWARDGFLADQFDAIIMIPLRSVQERSLEEAMMEYVGEDYPMLKKSAGSRCLLILEGLDEMSIIRRQSDASLRRLIERNTLLEKAKILITSRPHACQKLVVNRTVEVVGFGGKEIREFAKNSFPNDVESMEEFMRQLTEYPQLHSLCYVPLNLVMIINIFRYSQKKLPSTLTELYRLFIVMILQREVVKGCSVKKLTVGDYVEKALCKMLAGISKEAVGIVYLLSKLAYHAFFKSYSEREGRNRWGLDKKFKDPKIIFTESDLTENGIEVTSEFNGFGLLKVTHTCQLLGNTATYNFLHLTIQEFLCSLYMSTLSQQEQLNLLTEHFSDYPNVLMFLCGLTGLASNEMFKFVCSKLSSSKSAAYLGESVPYVVTAVRMAYESNQSNSSQLSLPFTLAMSYNTLSPYDCLCLSWVLSRYPVSQLEMTDCHIEDTGAKLLVRHYPNNYITGQLLEVLDLWGNDLTIAGLEDVMKIVRTNRPTLRVLNVGGNPISNNGMSMISEELQHNNLLTELSVERCGLSAKGAIAVSKLLMRNHTLQVLNVTNNTISDDGISVIVEHMQNITTLTKLNVGKCGLSVKGAIVISKLLMNNSMIKELWMSDNNIGDDGITAIATALTNSRISQLWIVECGITLTGARSIASLLSLNQSIRELVLAANAITLEGARLILQSAVNNKACQARILINDEYESDSQVQTMINILKDRSWMTTNLDESNLM